LVLRHLFRPRPKTGPHDDIENRQYYTIPRRIVFIRSSLCRLSTPRSVRSSNSSFAFAGVNRSVQLAISLACFALLGLFLPFDLALRSVSVSALLLKYCQSKLSVLVQGFDLGLHLTLSIQVSLRHYVGSCPVLWSSNSTFSPVFICCPPRGGFLPKSLTVPADFISQQPSSIH
jgi:hypothetical protein